MTVKKGDSVKHTRYGVCTVLDVSFCFGEFFGMAIQPTTENGKNLLAIDCGVPNIPVMEDKIKYLKINKS